MKTRFALTLAVLMLLTVCGFAQTPAPRPVPVDLTQVSLEELLSVEVTSVGRKEQKLSAAGAAVYVMSSDEIRHSGAIDIPDLLRMVPGVHVARLDANTWAISIRGFTDRYGDKVLVLIDGRSVYSPTSSGVNWDQQDVVLEDIDRIEVIRGPGGTVWGANAVNGVINIITKSSSATEGGLVTAVGGSGGTAQGLVRSGGHLGAAGTYRVFGQYSNIGNSPSPGGEQVTDGWHKFHGGFRSDWDLNPRDTLTVQSDIFQSRESQTIETLFSNSLPVSSVFDDRVEVGSADVLGRWKRTLSNGSDITVQGYWDRYNRLGAGLREIRNTLDLDFSHHLRLASRHDVVWGFGIRATGDDTTPGYSKSYTPASRTDKLLSGFLQDEIRITRSVSLTAGAKLEHNSYTGFEYEPSAQLVWEVTPSQTIWTSAARAIRQPAQADIAIRHDVGVYPIDSPASNGAEFGVVTIAAAAFRRAERLYDFEAGYRAQINKRFSIDLAAFSSYYHGLQTAEPGGAYQTGVPPPLHEVTLVISDGLAHAHNYGGELSATWKVTSRWKITSGWTFLQMHVAGDKSSQDPGAGDIATLTPKHQFQVHSLLNLTRLLDVDCHFYHTGRLPNEAGDVIAAYTQLDTSVRWRIGEKTEVSLVGQNLLQPTHEEFQDDEMLHTLVGRRVFGKISWRF